MAFLGKVHSVRAAEERSLVGPGFHARVDVEILHGGINRSKLGHYGIERFEVLGVSESGRHGSLSFFRLDLARLDGGEALLGVLGRHLEIAACGGAQDDSLDAFGLEKRDEILESGTDLGFGHEGNRKVRVAPGAGVVVAERDNSPIVGNVPDAFVAFEGVRALLAVHPVHHSLNVVAADCEIADFDLARGLGVETRLKPVDMVGAAVEIGQRVAEIQHIDLFCRGGGTALAARVQADCGERHSDSDDIFQTHHVFRLSFFSINAVIVLQQTDICIYFCFTGYAVFLIYL